MQKIVDVWEAIDQNTKEVMASMVHYKNLGEWSIHSLIWNQFVILLIFLAHHQVME